MTKNATYKIVADKLMQNLKFHHVNIVDYGCGDGLFCQNLINTNCTYIGYDSNPESIKKAINKFSQDNFHFRVIDKKSFIKFPHKKIDAVIAIGVIQYLTNNQITNLFKQSKIGLNKNGLLIFTCTSNHILYRVMNIYQAFLPHKYFDKSTIKKTLQLMGYNEIEIKERGLILSPMFANFIVFFFDFADKLFFKTRGELGPIGKGARNIFEPFRKIEFSLPINFGYTMIISAKKDD